MRIKYLIPAALTAAALMLAGCSTSSLPDSVKTGGLDSDQKAVVEAWYDASKGADQKRIEKMSATEIKAAVSAFALLCLVNEEQRAKHLTTGENGLSKDGAADLADAIDDHLCKTKHKPKTSKDPKPKETGKDKQTPKPDEDKKTTGPDQDASSTPKETTSAAGSLNPTHDLTKPTSRHDREEATLRAPANREPAWTHNDTGAKKAEPRSAAKAPARVSTSSKR